MLADGTMFEGEAIGAEPRGGVATGEVVFNTVLSGYQEVITDPSLRRADHHLHLPAHRQLRRDTSPTTRPPAVLPRRRRPRPRPAGRRTGAATVDLDAFLRARTASPASPASTPAASPGTSATPAPCPARSARADEAASRAAAAAEPGTDGIDLVAEVTHPEPVHGRRRRPRSASSRTTSASSARSCATSRARPGRGRARVDDRGRRAAREPDGSSCRTARRSGRGAGAADAIARPARGRCRSSASASGISCSPAIGADPSSCPFGHHGGNHPVQQPQSKGQVEIASQIPQHRHADADAAARCRSVAHAESRRRGRRGRWRGTRRRARGPAPPPPAWPRGPPRPGRGRRGGAGSCA